MSDRDTSRDEQPIEPDVEKIMQAVKRPRKVEVTLETPEFAGRKVAIGVVKFGRWQDMKHVLVDPLVSSITDMMKESAAAEEADPSDKQDDGQPSKSDSAKFLGIVQPVMTRTMKGLDAAAPELIRMCALDQAAVQDILEHIDDLDAGDVIAMKSAVEETNDIEGLLDAEKKYLAHIMSSLISVMHSMNLT